jgi:hypothetical protein
MIRQVEVDEYHVAKMTVVKGRLIVEGGYGDVILTIVDDDGSRHRANVIIRDLERAIEAVRQP